MKKILLIATAALFAWTASAQDNNYRNTRDNNRNAAQAGNYRSTPDNYRSAVGPRVNFYANTGDASVGIGAYYRYSFDSHWRIEPSIYVLTEKDSSVDINFDAISAGLKYEPMFDSGRSNPLVVFVGAAYRF